MDPLDPINPSNPLSPLNPSHPINNMGDDKEEQKAEVKHQPTPDVEGKYNHPLMFGLLGSMVVLAIVLVSIKYKKEV